MERGKGGRLEAARMVESDWNAMQVSPAMRSPPDVAMPASIARQCCRPRTTERRRGSFSSLPSHMGAFAPFPRHDTVGVHRYLSAGAGRAGEKRQCSLFTTRAVGGGADLQEYFPKKPSLVQHLTRQTSQFAAASVSLSDILLSIVWSPGQR